VITVEQYFMGRDKQFAGECNTEIVRNAEETVLRTNQLKQIAAATEGFVFPSDEVASGWRPAAVNDATCNAAKSSTHLSGEGLDTRDPERKFARWCLRNLHELERLGLWMEDPRWTPTWVHLQTRPPASGKRVFIPSSKPPLAPSLPEQRGTA
jgi:hypothetical protein